MSAPSNYFFSKLPQLEEITTDLSNKTENVLQFCRESINESATINEAWIKVVEDKIQPARGQFFKTVEDATKSAQKGLFQGLGMLGSSKVRKLVNFAFPDCINCFSQDEFSNIHNKVVFTIDDGPCRGPLENSLMNEVLDLLQKYDAHATFFTISNYIENKESLITELLEKGHEMGNHCPEDIKYHKFSVDDFEEELMKSDQILNQFVSNPIRIFRPPGGRLSKNMASVLHDRGFVSVMADCYGNDTNCEDAEWSAELIVSHAHPGSIICCHMPEKGFREWTLKEIELVLDGLKGRGFEIVNFTEMVNSCPQDVQIEVETNVYNPENVEIVEIREEEDCGNSHLIYNNSNLIKKEDEEKEEGLSSGNLSELPQIEVENKQKQISTSITSSKWDESFSEFNEHQNKEPKIIHIAAMNNILRDLEKFEEEDIPSEITDVSSVIITPPAVETNLDAPALIFISPVEKKTDAVNLGKMK